MAIWQNSFFVFDKASIEDLKSGGIDKEGFIDERVYWSYTKTAPDLFGELSEFLPIGESWSENLTVYGNLESNCFEIFHEENEVFSCSFRIDFTTDYEVLVSRIIDFLEGNNMIILDAEDLEKVPLNAFSIDLIIKNSRNYRVHHNLVEGNDPEIEY